MASSCSLSMSVDTWRDIVEEKELWGRRLGGRVNEGYEKAEEWESCSEAKD